MPPGKMDRRPRVVHLPAAVKVLRAASLVAVALAALQVFLHLVVPVGELDVIALVLAGVVALASIVMAWIAWCRPAMTSVDGDGVSVRARSLRAERYDWSQIERVQPAASGAPLSMLHPRDGHPAVPLPGVDRDAGLWLAGLVHHAHAVGDRPTPTGAPAS